MTANTVLVGDFFYRSWGYDQTNVNFYQVVGLTKTGKSIKLREVSQTTREYVNSVGSDSVGMVPVAGQWYSDEVLTKRLRTDSGYNKPSAYFNTYSDLYLWDGTPKYDTCALGYTGH